MPAKAAANLTGRSLFAANLTKRTFVAKATQDPLPYDFNALEPVLSARLMDLHYNKHHHNYVMKYNERLELVEEALGKKDLKGVASYAEELRFFGGGHYNHTFFWESLAPVNQGGGQVPSGSSDLAAMIR